MTALDLVALRVPKPASKISALANSKITDLPHISQIRESLNINPASMPPLNPNSMVWKMRNFSIVPMPCWWAIMVFTLGKNYSASLSLAQRRVRNPSKSCSKRQLHLSLTHSIRQHRQSLNSHCCLSLRIRCLSLRLAPQSTTLSSTTTMGVFSTTSQI